MYFVKSKVGCVTPSEHRFPEPRFETIDGQMSLIKCKEEIYNYIVNFPNREILLKIKGGRLTVIKPVSVGNDLFEYQTTFKGSEVCGKMLFTEIEWYLAAD